MESKLTLEIFELQKNTSQSVTLRVHKSSNSCGTLKLVQFNLSDTWIVL